MLKRWHHGHSFLGGGIAGAVIAHDGRTMFALGLALGIVAAVTVVYARRLALALLRALGTIAPEGLASRRSDRLYGPRGR